MINFAARDVHNLREQTTMLENQNHFLESEFQRQVDRIVQEKNDQIARLTHIIDQTCSAPRSESSDFNHASSNSCRVEESFDSNVKSLFR